MEFWRKFSPGIVFVIAISFQLNVVCCVHSLHEKFDLFIQLISAVTQQDTAAVQSLLEQGVNPNVEIQYISEVIMPAMTGKSQIIHPINLMGISVTSSSEDVLRRLLAAGGNPNAVIDGDGRRPFHAAIDRGHTGMIKALARRGADVHVVHYGDNLLHHAISVHEVDVIKLLLKLGANPHEKDKDGRDSLKASRDSWCRGCEMILLKHLGKDF